MAVLLPHTYLGPIHYYRTIATHQHVILENYENFPKQTFRNRCVIYGANGALNLTVPTLHISGERSMHIRRISYRENWQKLHWKSLETAYRSSPFFEYYEDDFSEVLMAKYELLIDLNTALMKLVLGILDIQVSLSQTSTFELNFDGVDLRDFYTPQSGQSLKEDFKRYSQVFEDKHGFIPNLSIVDLIFNQGPGSKDYLNNLVTSNDTNQ